MPQRTVFWLAATMAVLLLPLSANAQQGGDRIRIDSADQLPRHSYAVPESATRLVEDEAQFAALAGELQADLRSDLARYEIGDRATLKEYYSTLGSLALLQADHDAALAYADSARAIEDKPALRALAGTLERALSAAAQAPETDREAVFEDAFRNEIAALPYDVVQAELKTLKVGPEIWSPGLVLGLVQGQVEPAAQSGEISRELADLVVFARLYLEVLRPFQDEMLEVLDETISAHTVEKPDIWAARYVSLEGRNGLTPVILAIWDTGVDVALYDRNAFVNEDEIPDNGIDDDGNGFVDDAHGIAHDLHAQRTTGVLIPLSYGQEEEARYRRHLKGFMDLQAGLDTPDASEFKRLISGLKPEEVRPFLEGFRQYSNYAHGTHVAGIALAGNPAGRVLVARFTPDHRMVPELPTVELAEAWAQMFREYVAYFRDHGVRVVNMSWRFTPQDEERSLELNNAGGTPEERKALAQRLFDIAADALREAIAGAPDILFVGAAGNEDEDNRFVESAPASFDLPNLLTAAAVDRAGDEAAFTSYGKAEVYANGYEVESSLPGGERSALSGTSMAAPQVVNLAGKLLAVYPDLTVAQLRELILEGTDEKTVGEGKTIRLLNPKRSFELAEEELGDSAEAARRLDRG
jgi:subtilisin family serine protease